MKRWVLIMALVCLFLFVYARRGKQEQEQVAPGTNTAESATPRRGPRPAESKLNKILELAKENDLEVLSSLEEPLGVINISLAGPDHTRFNSFLSDVQTNVNLQDFKTSTPRTSYTQTGRARMEVTYTFTYR